MARQRPTDAAIVATDLSVSRTGRGARDARVVEGVSFRVRPGRTLAVMGPTGAGKSSLCVVLAGDLDSGATIVGGEASVLGIPLRRPGRAHREHTYHTGYVPQAAGAALPSRLTVSDVVAAPITSRTRKVDARALAVRVATLLDEVQLPLGAATKFPYELSAGMRQRVALARALVLEPSVLVADDPLANLDVEARAAALGAILRRRDAGMASVIVTNDPDVVATLDADVLVLRGGHAIGFGHGVGDVLWVPDTAADHRVIAS